MTSTPENKSFPVPAEIEKIEVIPIGGTVDEDITGSMYILVLTIKGIKKKVGYIIDSGSFQGSLSAKNSIFPEIIHTQNIDIRGILLTHLHADHVGRLAQMHKMLTNLQNGPIPIYASKETIQMFHAVITSFLNIPHEIPLARGDHTVSIEDAFNEYLRYIIQGRRSRTSMRRKGHNKKGDIKRERSIEINNDLEEILSKIRELKGDIIEGKLVHNTKNKNAINQLNSLFTSYKKNERKSRIPFITGKENDETHYTTFEIALHLEFAHDEERLEKLRSVLDEIPSTNKQMESWKIKFYKELETARAGYKQEYLPHVSEGDIRNLMTQMIPCNTRKPVEIEHGTLTPVPTAHTLGSLGYRLQFDTAEKVFRILFSGDVGRSTNNPYGAPDLTAKVDDNEKKDDVVFMECTASYTHAEYQKEIDAMVLFLEKILAEGKEVIVPTFAFERMQIFMLAILKLKKQDRLPDFDFCYRNRLGEKLMPFYMRALPEMQEAFKLFRLFDGEDYQKKENLGDTEHKPRCIIGSGGCIQPGSTAGNLQKCLPDTALLFIGYQVTSPGKEFLEEISKNGKAVLEGVEYRKENVHYCRALSGHADKEEIVEHLQELTSGGHPCKVIAVHGQQSPQELWEKSLEPSVEIIVPQPGKTIRLA